MGENHWKVPLALIKFSKIDNFNAKLFIHIEISYNLKYLFKFLTTISKLYI